MRKKYDSDVTREQFKLIEPILIAAKKITRPREVDLYDVFCAVLYVMKTGCQWRMLPSEFPDYRNVHRYFQIWGKREDNKASILEKALQQINKALRKADGRTEKPTLCIIDAQSVKNANTSQTKGYDGGKKVSGIKRHIAVDSQGNLHGVALTAASVTDRAGAIQMFERNAENLSEVSKVLADGGYTGKNFSKSVKKIIGADVEVVKRDELHKFKVLPKRWVVERSFAWLECCRRLVCQEVNEH